MVEQKLVAQLRLIIQEGNYLWLQCCRNALSSPIPTLLISGIE